MAKLERTGTGPMELRVMVLGLNVLELVTTQPAQVVKEDVVIPVSSEFKLQNLKGHVPRCRRSLNP